MPSLLIVRGYNKREIHWWLQMTRLSIMCQMFSLFLQQISDEIKFIIVKTEQNKVRSKNLEKDFWQINSAKSWCRKEFEVIKRYLPGLLVCNLQKKKPEFCVVWDLKKAKPSIVDLMCCDNEFRLHCSRMNEWTVTTCLANTHANLIFISILCYRDMWI